VFDPAGNSDNGALGYTYDTVGNRLQMSSNVSVLPPSSVSYSYDGNDQLSTDLYDLNRNTTSSGGVSNIKYDFENHMTSYGTTTIGYDGDGNRVSETVGGTAPNNFKYGGEWLDSNVGPGLFYLRARYMNPATGRFWARVVAKYS